MDNRRSFQLPASIESQNTLLPEHSSDSQDEQSIDQHFYNYIPARTSMQLYAADPSMNANQLYRYSKHDSIMLDPSALQGFERNLTLRYIPLTPQGNLVIDIPVADRVLNYANYNTGSDFTHARYTAVTVGADDFVKKGYVLKQQEMDRKTEIFIVVTMYNEDHVLFCKTMAAIMKNISYLCSLNSRSWGPNGWQKVVVCIVSDGRSKIHRKVLDVLGIMGVYQDGIMKDSVNGEPVVGHLFEYTTQVCVTKDLAVRGSNSGYCPVQILFFLKENNAKKINSHRWFFNAFGPLLRPNICVLLDVGTKPSRASLYNIWREFNANKNVGGACGEIYADLGVGCSKLLNPIVAAQNFEYKTSNILDKPLESIFGYISVLPGAFSAYRYSALQGEPLKKYFKGETMNGGDNIFAANMFLAEDRILCFEVVTKENAAWTLKYVKNAKAETDVPDHAAELISQRRRWMNGSVAATIHALLHWHYIYRSDHGILRKILLTFQMIYNFLGLIFSWFLLSSLYLGFFFLATSDFGTKKPFFGKEGETFSVLRGLYVTAIMMIVICSLGNRPQATKWIFILCMWLFSVVTVATIYLSAFTFVSIFQDLESSESIFSVPVLRDLLVALFSLFGIYFISGIAYLDPWHCITSFVQYTFFFMSYPNILNVYAFCNLHDVTWGTKGDNVAESLGGVQVVKKGGKDVVSVALPSARSDINSNYEVFVKGLQTPDKRENAVDLKVKQQDYFKSFRTYTVLAWFFSNALVIVALTNDFLYSLVFRQSLKSKGEETNAEFNPYTRFLFYFVAIISGIRVSGSLLYLIQWYPLQLIRKLMDYSRKN